MPLKVATPIANMRSVVAGLSLVDHLNSRNELGDDMGAYSGTKLLNLFLKLVSHIVQFHHNRVIIPDVVIQPSLSANFILVVFEEDFIMKVNITCTHREKLCLSNCELPTRRVRAIRGGHCCRLCVAQGCDTDTDRDNRRQRRKRQQETDGRCRGHNRSSSRFERVRAVKNSKKEFSILYCFVKWQKLKTLIIYT